MPLKVSSQGWVKVAPPPRPRRRQPDPEEQKEALRSPLRYFACQGVDDSRERLRMLGARGGFSSSEVDLIRPHSRLERSSTLDEWRWDTHQSRSSSRQSGNFMESSSPPKDHLGHAQETSNSHAARTRSNSERNSDGHNGGRSSRASGEDRGSRLSRDNRKRVSSAPVVIPVSPPGSLYDDAEEVVEVEVVPDHVSVAYSETPSERHCRHNHHHRRERKPPAVIPEEEELETEHFHTTGPTPLSLHTGSELCSRRHLDDELPSPVSIPAPPPTIARSNTCHSRKTEVEIPSPIPESEPTISPVSETVGSRSEKPPRSERSDSPARSKRSGRSERSSRSEGSSRSSYSSHSSSYRSRRAESESSYTASVRSASPVNDRQRSRDHRQDHKDDDTESYYPSPPPSPRLSARKSRHDSKSSEAGSRLHRDRVVTAPASTPRSRYDPGPSTSSWTSGSVSSGSRSSAPSINGYQLQAAIFQPKNYRGYRAPSLSKGNRWETATSALSFD